MSIELVWEHLFIVVAASVASIILGVGLGVAAYLSPKARGVILQTVDILQTIPALALLGILMVFFGAGKPTVVAGITLYSLLPIVRNTTLGFDEVDAGVKEAARGMGMSRTVRLVQVEFPLAFPTIFTGIRIAIVNAIGTAVFAAFVGGGGLGSVINRGIRIQDKGLILGGTAVLMGIAVVLDFAMGWAEGRMRKSHGSLRVMALTGAALAAAFLALLPVGLGGRASGTELLLYDGDYSETQIMHHMVELLVEDKTDLEVTVQDQMSQVNNYRALIGANHSCDMMISYDGTLLTTFLGLDPTDVPAGQAMKDFANAEARSTSGVYLLENLGFDNTYAIAVREEVAERYGLHTISDLAAVAGELSFGAEHEFFTQEGSMKFGPFTKFYGLDFKDVVSVDVSLKYAAAEAGSFDVTEVYATDGLNRKAGLRVLEDDRSFFPDYNGAFLVREDTFEKFAAVAPNLEEVLDLLAGQIANEDMVNMTYAVDVEGKSVESVARDFLIERGLLAA